MCGIAGIYNINKNTPVQKTTLQGMCDVIKHRGPDDEGFYVNGNIGLGMRRLSIIDLSTGHQPIASENNKIWVVLNGEIYNFLELRRDLEKKHTFYTKTDTETLVHLYEEYGVDCLKHLRGMYAFALWDEHKKQLFIARDRIGKKPLYYTRIGDSFYFGSEMKCFLKIPGFKKDINIKAIHYYLTYQYIPGPMTIWNNVFRLDPGSYLIMHENGTQEIQRYWAPDLRTTTALDYTEAKERLKTILTEATKLRMIADVPLGAFLSGGVDSSVIVGLMSQLSTEKVKTFSIGFSEKEFSEVAYASVVAKHFNTDHHELIVKPDYIHILPKIVWHYDQPYADCSAVPSYYVSQITRQHVTVALNGDGGDENFAGYLRYKAVWLSTVLAPFMRMVPNGALALMSRLIPMNESVSTKSVNRYFHRLIKPLKYPASRRNLLWHAYFSKEMKDSIYSQTMIDRFANDDAYGYLEEKFNNAPARDNVGRSLYADLTGYLPEDLLIKMDIASMANSLEARSPLLDQEFLEFTATLPSHWKLSRLRSKHIFKDTFKDFLPPAILNRKKQGFSMPVGKWFRYELKDYFRETVLSKKALDRGYFDKHKLNAFFDHHVTGRADYGYCLWALLMLELWHQVFVDGELYHE